MIYPENLLTPITGNYIGRISFESPGQSELCYQYDTLEVRIGFCADTSFCTPAFDTSTVLTLVYRGPISIHTSSMLPSQQHSHSYMILDFDTMLQYNGGNLLIDIRVSQYNYNGSHYWNGTTRTGATVHKTLNGVCSITNVLPKIIIDYQPSSSCRIPQNCVASDREGHSVNLSWTDIGNSQSWSVEYGPSLFSLGTGSIVYSQDTFITINGLSPLTEYRFVVRAVCDTAQSIYQQIIAKTGCSLIDSLPIMYNFNVDPVAQTPDNIFVTCWTRYSSMTNSFYYQYPLVNSNHCLEWYYLCPNRNGILYAVLPSVDTSVFEINRLRMRCLAKRNMGSQFTTPNLEFGIMNNTEDTASFTPLGLITPQTDNYTQFDILATNYHGNGTTFAFRTVPGDSSFWLLYLDNVEILESPPCTQFTSDVFNDSIFLSWTANGHESGWILNYDGISIPVDTNFYGIGGLIPYTEYNITVYAIMNNGDTLGPCLFSTTTYKARPIEEYPYFCGFDGDEGQNWEFSRYINSNLANNTWRVGNSIYHDSTEHMSLYTSPDTCDRYGLIDIGNNLYAFRPFILDTGQYSFSYDWISGGEQNYDYLRVVLIPADRSIIDDINMWTRNTLPYCAIPIDNHTELTMNRYWTTESGHFSIEDSGMYLMVFFWRNDSYYNDGHGPAIDNVRLDHYRCPLAENISIIDSGLSYIVLEWDGNGVEQWLVEYGEAGFVQGYGTTTTINAGHIRINGLIRNNIYDFRIYTICDDSVDWNAVKTVRYTSKTCDSTNEVQVCASETSYSNTLIEEHKPYSLSETLYTNEELGVSNTFSAISIYNSSYVLLYGYDNISIYLTHTQRTNLSDASGGFVALDSAELVYQGNFNLNHGWNTILFDSPFEYNGTDNLIMAVVNNSNKSGAASLINFYAEYHYESNRVRIYGSNNFINTANIAPLSGGCVSYITYTKFLSCENRGCMTANGAEVLWTSHNEAQIHWQSSETQYEIRYKRTDDTIWNSPILTFDTALLIQGLDAGTTYSLEIRCVCDIQAERFSEWIDLIFTTTDCPNIEDLSVIEVGATTASLSWDNGSEGFFIFRYRQHDNGENYIMDTTDVGFITIEDLRPSTQYEAQVAQICIGSSKSSVLSKWSDSVLFTTDSLETIGLIDAAVVKVFPNPTDNILTIELNGFDGKVDLRIMSSRGQTMWESTTSCDSHCRQEIEVQSFPSGIYIVLIESENKKIVKKTVVL